jgi:hypothetical protein
MFVRVSLSPFPTYYLYDSSLVMFSLRIIRFISYNQDSVMAPPSYDGVHMLAVATRVLHMLHLATRGHITDSRTYMPVSDKVYKASHVPYTAVRISTRFPSFLLSFAFSIPTPLLSFA